MISYEEAIGSPIKSGMTAVRRLKPRIEAVFAAPIITKAVGAISQDKDWSAN